MVLGLLPCVCEEQTKATLSSPLLLQVVRSSTAVSTAVSGDELKQLPRREFTTTTQREKTPGTREGSAEDVVEMRYRMEIKGT